VGQLQVHRLWLSLITTLTQAARVPKAYAAASSNAMLRRWQQ